MLDFSALLDATCRAENVEPQMTLDRHQSSPRLWTLCTTFLLVCTVGCVDVHISIDNAEDGGNGPAEATTGESAGLLGESTLSLEGDTNADGNPETADEAGDETTGSADSDNATTAPADEGESSTGEPANGTESTSTADPSGSTGGALADCSACVQGSCGGEIAACFAEPACLCILQNCLMGGAGDVQACMMDCGESSATTMLLGCVGESCPTECGGLAPPTP